MKRLMCGFVACALVGAALSAGPVRAAAPAAAPAAAEDLLPETVGTFSSAYLYQTYMSLVMLADAKTRGAFDEKVAAEYLQTTVNLLDLADGQLARLLKSELPKDRREFFVKLQVTGGLLKKQAGLLRSAWSSRLPEDLAKLEQARRESWAKISEVIGLK